MYPFMKTLLLSIVALFSIAITSMETAQAADQSFYQIKIYHLKTQAQEDLLDNYFKNAYLPALRRAGIKQIGVFKPNVKDTADVQIYVFIPFSKLDQLGKLGDALLSDKKYQADGKEYLDAEYNKAPYTRVESIILKAFAGMPQPGVPNLTAAKADRIYELRSYEAATEKLSKNKIKQFNEAGEITIFKNLNFNAVFYGEVISGPKMPNLMYMTTFNNKTEHDKLWVDFNKEYAPIRVLPEYQHNVSKNTITFLHPADYSDF